MGSCWGDRGFQYFPKAMILYSYIQESRFFLRKQMIKIVGTMMMFRDWSEKSGSLQSDGSVQHDKVERCCLLVTLQTFIRLGGGGKWWERLEPLKKDWWQTQILWIMHPWGRQKLIFKQKSILDQLGLNSCPWFAKKIWLGTSDSLVKRR